MNRNELFVALLAVSFGAACKGGNSINGSGGQPGLGYSGSQAQITCLAADTNNVVTCELDFGGVPIGQSVTANLSISNTSASPFQIVSQTANSDPQFTVQQLQNLPIEVIQNVAIAVTFKPFNEDALNDSFSLGTDAQSVTKFVVTMKGSGIKLALAINPTSLDFGKVIVHSSLSKDLNIQNLSTGPITLTPISPQGNSQSLFKITPPAGFQYTDQIQPNDSRVFTVTFSPTQPSYADENAYLVVGYATNKFINVELKGFGVKSGIQVTTDPATGDGSSTRPSFLTFGHIPLLNSKTDHIYVENISNQTVKLYTADLSGNAAGGFSVGGPLPDGTFDPGSPQVLSTDTPFTLNPGDKLEYPITFAPAQGTGYSAQFSVTSDHGDYVTVPISGGGGGPAISCVTIPYSAPPPALVFGDVAVDIGATLSLQCTNTGNDITINGNIDPNAELLVYASQLQINQPGASYSAQLMVDGVMTPFAQLRRGQSFIISVTYNPIAATPVDTTENGTLIIPSNAVLTPVVQVPLSGSGLVLTDCNLALAPTSLAFNQITVGQAVQLPVTLANNGNTKCLVNGLALSPSTDAAFSLVSPPLPGAAPAPYSPPTSITLDVGGSTQVLVQFKPDVIGSYSGLLNFVVSSKSAPSQIVPISGSAGTACLIVNPQELDFGSVGEDKNGGSAWCGTKSHQIHALNACTFPLLITGLQNSAQSGDFRLTSSPSLPHSLAPGQFFEFDEQFQPKSTGIKWGSATIVAQPQGGGPATSYLAAFHGNADTSEQVDTYVIPPAKVDIMWVVDYSDAYALQYAIQPIAQNLQTYFDALGGVDYHLAVISAIDCPFPEGQNQYYPAATDLGQILPCSGCTDGTSSTAKIFTQADQDPAGGMAAIMNTLVANGLNDNPEYYYYYCEGNYPIENEGGNIFQPAYLALQSGLMNGHNSGFYRDDAALVVIGLNNTDDCSEAVTGNNELFYYTFFENLKGFNPLTPFIFNAISVTEAELNTYECPPPNNNLYLQYYSSYGCHKNIQSMVAQTGGELVDICTTDWKPSLTSLGQLSSAIATTFVINGSPVNPPVGIELAINGGLIPQVTRDGGTPIWTYDPLTGTLTFLNPAFAPASGDILTITYTNVCY